MNKYELAVVVSAKLEDEARADVIEKVKALSPLEKLNHGYAYVQDERGRSVRSISGICKGENLSVYVTDGVICAEVREVKEEKHG